MTSNDPHAPSTDVAYASLAMLATAMDDGAPTSADLTRALLARIDAVDAPSSELGLRSVLAVADDVVAVAEERDRERLAGRVRGPLHGMPVLLKDNIEAVGLPGTAGSHALAERAVTADAPLVTRLRDAGAVVLGATNLSEWANFRSPRSVSGWSGVGGLTGNPWALDRSAGGSSAGSGAAVAAGLAPVAIGTETNGSITCPAALNGVVGLKPTVGSVSAQQVVPISASQDVPGPLARSVADAALVYEVLSGRDDCLAACTPEAAASLRVGVAEQWLSGHAGTDALFAAAVEALTALVAGVSRVDLPPNDFQVHDDQVTVLVHEMADDLDAYLAARPGPGVRTLADAVAFNREHADIELAHFGQEYLEAALASGGRDTDAYRTARERNVAFARDACLGPAFASGVDVLVSPAYQPAWKSDLVHGDQVAGGGANCTPPAILGWPILTVPMGIVDGLPVGFSIVGQANTEPLLLAVGHALEQALGLAGSPALRPAWRAPMRG
jgi:amidase